MKLEKLVGERFKERPADCVIDSHAIMVKGGYIKYMANGIYSSYLPLRRIVRKIEQILREEMDKIDGQEVQFPVVMPASLWDESGRYDSIGAALHRPQQCQNGTRHDPRGGSRTPCTRVCTELHQISVYDLSDPDKIP